MNTTAERIEALTEAGFTLETSQPRAYVSEENWPAIEYTVILSFKGRKVITTEYRLGVGHVDPKKERVHTTRSAMSFTSNEESMLFAWQSKPGANFTNKQLQAEVAAKLARIQKVAPQLDDVLHSLLMDGNAFFNAQTFETWAGDLGYDTDSRKAEQIFKACDDIGRKLAGGIPKKVLDSAREITQDM